jgi:hypothetical protein
MKRVDGLYAGVPGGGTEDLSPTAQVKAALAAAAGPRSGRTKQFAFDRLSPREAAVAPLLGIYLGVAVARLHERFPVLAVPMLLSALMAIMLATLLFAVPAGGWRQVWRASKQFRLVAAIAALAVITIPFGIWMRGSFDFLVNHFVVAIAVYIACLLLLRDRRTLRKILSVYVLIVVVVAVKNLTVYFDHDVDTTLMSDEDRLAYEQAGGANAGTIRQAFGSLDPNDIAAVMATTFPLALWLATGSFARRIFWTPCALVLVVAVIPTASRGGLLGLVGAAVILSLVGARGGRRIFLILMLVLGAMAFMSVAGGQMDRMDNINTGDYNFNTGEGRILIWKRGIVWTLKRPWGYGLDNFPVYFGWLNGPERAAHNSLIQYSVELGVLGITAYLMIGFTLIKSLLQMRRRAMQPGSMDTETIALTGHVMATLTGCWVTGFFLSNAYYPLTYMVIGVASAVVLSANAATPSALPPVAVSTRGPMVAGRRQRQFRPAPGT